MVARVLARGVVAKCRLRCEGQRWHTLENVVVSHGQVQFIPCGRHECAACSPLTGRHVRRFDVRKRPSASLKALGSP